MVGVRVQMGWVVETIGSDVMVVELEVYEALVFILVRQGILREEVTDRLG
jgi:hypothetical protein